MEASLHPDGGYYALKDGEAPAQSMRSKNLRHVVLFFHVVVIGIIFTKCKQL
jgi:hypothetical protein